MADDVVATGLRPGDPMLLREEAEAVPEGTVAWHVGRKWTKTKNGLWLDSYNNNAGNFHPDESGSTVLLSYPDGVKTQRDTLEQHKWRIFDGGLESGRRFSVNGVPQAMAELGVAAGQFPFGVGQRVSYNRHLAALPQGTVMAVGDPAMDSYSLFEKDEADRWRKIMGSYPHNLFHGRIEQIGDDEVHQDWIDAEPDEVDARRIKSFRGRVWQIGDQYRRQYGWCDSFLTVMGSMNISQDSVADIDPSDVAGPGEMVLPNGAINLPYGTLFEYVTDAGIKFWYVRRQHHNPNRAGTRRFTSWLPDGTINGNPAGHYPGQGLLMRVLGRPGEEVPLTADRDANLRLLWEALPPGTEFRFQTQHNGGRTYTKTGMDTFTNAEGREQRVADFEWRRVYIVVPTS